jgi:hypothetical protein
MEETVSRRDGLAVVLALVGMKGYSLDMMDGSIINISERMEKTLAGLRASQRKN